MNAAPNLSSLEVARIANVSLRQLHWWCANEIIRPSLPYGGPGTRLRFTEVEARRIVLFAKIAKTCGLSRVPDWNTLAKMQEEGGLWIWDAVNKKVAKPDFTAAHWWREYQGVIVLIDAGEGEP